MEPAGERPDAGGIEPSPRRPALKRLARRTKEIWRRFRAHPRWFDAATSPPRFRLTLERGALLFAAALFTTGLLASLSAVLGLFRLAAPVLLSAWLAAVVLVLVAAALRRIRVEGDRADLAALAIALLAAASAGFLHHHYYASQADIGFYVSDAAVIAATGGRSLDGPYDGLLPGFSGDAGDHRPAHLFGYPSLAALFAYAAGPFLTPLVNVPLAFLTATTLYLVGRQLGARSGALLGALLWTTSLITVWFGRWTMTENAAAATFWVAALLMLRLARGFRADHFALLLVALGYGALVRPEGIAVLAWFLLVLAVRFAPDLRAALARLRLAAPRILFRPSVAAAAAGALLLLGAAVALLLRALPFQYLRSQWGIAVQILQGRAAADAYDVPTTGPGPNWGDYALRFEWESSLAYHLPWFLLVGALGVLLRVVPWRRALFLVLLSAPFLLFVMIPPVTTAHPWFMRRLWVALIPLAYVLAGASLDLGRVANRWPFRTPRRAEPRLLSGLLALLLALLFLGLQFQILAPVALKREDDSVRAGVELLLSIVTPGSAVVLDEGAVEYAALVRLSHDGPVVGWFNQRKASFFASVDATEHANGTFLVRAPAANRNSLETDPAGAVSFERHNLSLANTARRDFRVYLSEPPLASGYAPLSAYLAAQVPPNEWVEGTQVVDVIGAREPATILKNVRFDQEDWGRGALGVVALRPDAVLELRTDSFRKSIIEETPLALHVVYVQAGTADLVVGAEGHPGVLATLPSDGSGTLRNASIPLPVPLAVKNVTWPRGAVLRGALVDLA